MSQRAVDSSNCQIAQPVAARLGKLYLWSAPNNKTIGLPDCFHQTEKTMIVHEILFGNVWIWAEVNWLSIFGITAGVLLTCIVYRWQKRDKQPRFAKRSIAIVANAVKTYPNLTVHYKGHGEDLENLTVTLVAFWNHGRETIRRQDIAPADPVIIKVSEGCVLLGATIIANNNPVCRFASDFSKSQGKATLTFDYLDQQHGCVIELLHTGTSSKNVQVIGTIIGAGGIQDAVNGHRLSKVFGLIFGRDSKRSSRAYKRRMLMIRIVPQICLSIAMWLMFILVLPSRQRGIEQDGITYVEASGFDDTIVERSDKGIATVHWILPLFFRRFRVPNIHI